MESPDTNPAAVTEDNLCELLDSCLGDFNKPLPKTIVKDDAPTATSTRASVEDSKEPDSNPSEADFVKEFGKVVENLKAEYEKIDSNAEIPNWLPRDGESFDANFEKCFEDILGDMLQATKDIPQGPAQFEPSDLEDLNEYMPMMQNVMEKLMSKEVLYPSIKEIVEKYPDWLNQNKESLAAEAYENYSKQHGLMKKICEEFEVEAPEGSNKGQFERVIALMHQVHSHGNPPKDLISSVGPGLPLDDQGNLQIPGMPQMPQECTTM